MLADLTRQSSDNQNHVAREGGIEPLVRLLSTGMNADAKAEAAGLVVALVWRR